ncbi:MAG: HAD-IA family hydrolase [Actinomycetota bacterium]
MTVRAVVFDFGGVIISPITNKIAVLAERHRTELATMLEILMGPRHESTDHAWHRAERGELAVAEIQDLIVPVAAERGVELHGDEVDVMLDDQTYDMNTRVLDRIDALKGEVILGLLTNSFREFRPTLERDVDLTRFDVVMDSSVEGSRKPEAAIYRRTTEALGVPPESIVYLDDFDHNLGPATAEGWQTIHVSDPDEALVDLDRLLA